MAIDCDDSVSAMGLHLDAGGVSHGSDSGRTRCYRSKYWVVDNSDRNRCGHSRDVPGSFGDGHASNDLASRW